MVNFWYFIKRSLDDEVCSNPFCTDTFLGTVGDFIEIDGVGFYIVDYAIEYKEVI